MFKKVVSLAIAGCFVAGCSTPLKPVEAPADSPLSAEKAKARVEDRWTEPALEQDGQPMVVLYTPSELPKTVANIPLNLNFEPDMTIKDMVAILGRLGISVIVSDKEAVDQKFYLPSYKGSLGRMLAAVSRATDVWFTYQDGVIVASTKERIGIAIPQDEVLAKKVTDGLSALGITGSLGSSEAGMAALELKYSQYQKAKNFLQRITENAAMVSLQIAIVTVNMNQSDSQGIDWSKMQFALGKNGSSIFDPNGGAAPVTTTNADGTTTTTTASGSTSSSNSSTSTGSTGTNTTVNNGSTSVANTTLPAYLNTALFTGSSARLALSNSVFSLAGFVNFLGGYGSTETLQSSMLKTSTGNAVELKSVTQVPYVSSVGVATTGSTTSNGSASLLGSAKTDTAKDGMTVKLLPTYDARANTVSVKVDLSLQSVLAFNNLSAGTAIGSFTQPTTAERSFDNILRLRPGEFQVVGGITYESTGRNYTSPLPLRDTKYESSDLQIKKQTMFIVIRPTVRTYGTLEVRPSAELISPGVVPDEDVTHSKKASKAKAKSAIVEGAKDE